MSSTSFPGLGFFERFLVIENIEVNGVVGDL